MACSGLKQGFIPGQRMRSSYGSESTNSLDLDEWPEKRYWPFGFAEKEFPKRWKVVKHVFVRREKMSTVHVGRHIGWLRESSQTTPSR